MQERRGKPNSRGESEMSGDAENRSSMWKNDPNSISSDLISSFWGLLTFRLFGSQTETWKPSSQQLYRNTERGEAEPQKLTLRN